MGAYLAQHPPLSISPRVKVPCTTHHQQVPLSCFRPSCYTNWSGKYLSVCCITVIFFFSGLSFHFCYMFFIFPPLTVFSSIFLFREGMFWSRVRVKVVGGIRCSRALHSPSLKIVKVVTYGSRKHMHLSYCWCRLLCQYNRVFNPRLGDCRFFDHRSKSLSLAYNGEYIFGGGINILKSFNLRN